MIVGIFQIELFLPASRTLKDKRQVIQSLIQRIRAAYNISITETAYRDLRQRAMLGAAYISTGESQARALLDRLEQEIGSRPEVEVIDRTFNVCGFGE